LALTAGCPVVPVALSGTADIQPVGSKVLRIRRITIRFGHPLDFSHLKNVQPGRARREATDTIMAAIRDLSGQELVPHYNQPGPRVSERAATVVLHGTFTEPPGE
jgi:1-acyl-sn-glycerol-3-phosphate acyltransferase